MLRLGQPYTVAELLPHGTDMVLLDRLRAYDEDSATCDVTIRPDSRFSDGERGVPGWVGIEYMAQTLCAYIGVVRRQAGKNIQIELLLGTRSYDCTRPYFAPGTTLRIHAELLMRNPDGVCAFACEITDGADRVAQSEIKAYAPDNIEDYLNGLEREKT